MKYWVMPNKVLAFDLETSGIGEKFGLQQFACIVFIDGKEVDSLDIQIKLFENDLVDSKALEITGLDPTMGLEPRDAYLNIVEFFGKHIDKFNKKDKFTPIAYNGQFDIDGLVAFFKKNDDIYFGSWQNFNVVDPLPFFRAMRFLGKLDVPDLKLETMCNYFGIEIKAHDALSDIQATVKLTRIYMKLIKNIEFPLPVKDSEFAILPGIA